MRKLAFCICENKDADQLRGNHEADQRLCFRYTDSTISFLPKYEISSLQPSSVAVQPGLCGAWSETPKTSFLRTRLICCACLIGLAHQGNSYEPRKHKLLWRTAKKEISMSYVRLIGTMTTLLDFHLMTLDNRG